MTWRAWYVWAVFTAMSFAAHAKLLTFEPTASNLLGVAALIVFGLAPEKKK